MKRITSMLFALALVGACATAAGAQSFSPRVDRREARQESRIRQGFRHGQLTQREAKRLQRGQRHVHRMEWRSGRDGRLSARERARIERIQDRQSRRINRLRHNGRMA